MQLWIVRCPNNHDLTVLVTSNLNQQCIKQSNFTAGCYIRVLLSSINCTDSIDLINKKNAGFKFSSGCKCRLNVLRKPKGCCWKIEKCFLGFSRYCASDQRL